MTRRASSGSRAQHRGLPKDEALRRAQVSLLRGAPSDSASSDSPPAASPGNTRGVGGLVERDAPRREGDVEDEVRPPFRHPYFWSAFQLYGLAGEPAS